jgi:hypothetical protein
MQPSHYSAENPPGREYIFFLETRWGALVFTQWCIIFGCHFVFNMGFGLKHAFVRHRKHFTSQCFLWFFYFIASFNVIFIYIAVVIVNVNAIVIVAIVIVFVIFIITFIVFFKMVFC